MADIKKEDLKKKVLGLLKETKSDKLNAKKIIQQLEDDLDIDLSSRKKEVEELVKAYQNKDNKKNGDASENDDDNDDEGVPEEDEDSDSASVSAESEEEKKPKRGGAAKKAAPVKRGKKDSSDESDGISDEDDEYSPKKKVAKKAGGKRGAPKKKGSDDSDEDWGKKSKKRGPKKAGEGGAKRGGGGYNKPVQLSPELAKLVGDDAMPRHEVVKRVWAIIKERNLYDPKNKQYAICDADLLKVIGVKRFRTFGMMKFLKNHFIQE